MSDDAFDAIVVGAGCAGSVAAYTLAAAGKSVLVIERGNYAGAKNMTGGRIYCHSLKQVFPDFAKDAPLERRVTHEAISFISEDSNFTVDFTSPELAVEGKDAYTVLRVPFDQWLAEKAEAAGAEFIYGIRVDDLIVRDGRVCGVRAGEDELEAHVTILADGVNSLLAQKLGFLSEPLPSQIAVSAKELIELPSGVIEDRFRLEAGEGASWLFAGDASHQIPGGGFIYTNKESVSVGVVATLEHLQHGGDPIYQMLEDFKSHPAVRPLLAGGKLIEYSGHLVPEGGYKMLPKLVGDGVLVTGDAGMLCINLGYAVRGIDFAVSSGAFAAEATIQALEAGDTSSAALQAYQRMLEESYVIKDLKRFQKFPAFMESTTRIFNEYPNMIREMMLNLFVVDGKPADPLMKKLMRPVKRVGLITLARDAMKGVGAL
jgi:electron transfer flavoprotein-quinone oxidoreductase